MFKITTIKKSSAMLCVLIALQVSVHSQQRPYYTQYILNNYIINPAVAGIDNYTDIKISHRHQWVGLDGAPVTTYITVQGPLQKSAYDERDNPTTILPKGENPLGEPYWFKYKAAHSHQGIGLTVLNDQTGPLSHFGAYATFSHHQPLSAYTTLAIGVNAGINQISLNTDKLSFYTTIDPAVNTSGQLTQTKFDLSVGLLLYNKNYFIGFSMQQINPANLTFSDNIVHQQQGKLIPHCFIDLGYRFSVSDDISFLPSVMLRYVSPLPMGFDINTKLQYKQLLWVGATYRGGDSFAAMAGISISNTVSVGYSYDATTSELNLVSNGTHEIVVGFTLGNTYGSTCPRNIW